MPTATIPGIVHRPAHYLLTHTVFQVQAADEQGEFYRPRGLTKLSVDLSRTLIERGRRAPWMWSAERCQQFWASLERGDDTNAPNTYAAKPREIIDFMHAFWSPDVVPTDRVLEIGCNAGGNLAWLHQLGYSNLSGIEINPHAIAEMRRTHPALEKAAVIHQGEVEEVLPRLDTNSVDVIFTMGVLLHVHPSSNWIFAEMVRVSRGLLCVIEAEQVISHYVFCRDYSRVFGALGCQQLRSVEISHANMPEVPDAYYGATARLFRIPKA